MDTMHQITMRDGVRVTYRTTRQGPARPTLVLLHGLASNMTRWSEFVAMTDLRQNWDLLRLDLRGHGESICRSRSGMDVWSDDIAEVLRAEEVDQAVLAGHCLGANLALHCAARHPELVCGLVLIEPMFRQALSGSLAKVSALRALLTALVRPLLWLAQRGLHRRQVATIDLQDLDRQTRLVMAGAHEVLTKRYASIVEDLRIMPTSMFLQDLIAVTGPLPLERVRVPALALLSKGGAFGDPAQTATLLAGLATCRVEHIDALHWIPTEQPVAMRHAIEDWCSRFV